jgi:hypothetical protein
MTTNVDECISADAGVGASIASGNQTNKINCAHLHEAAEKIHSAITLKDLVSITYTDSTETSDDIPDTKESMLLKESVSKAAASSASAIKIQ